MRRITIDIGGAWVDGPREFLPGTIARATLLDDLAPIACQTLWDLLPLETRAIHTFWSGQGWRTEVNVPLRTRDVPTENPVGNVDLAPGDIAYFMHDELPLQKVVCTYGKARWPADDVSLIARVDENLDELIRMSRRVLFEGAKHLIIRRYEGS